MQYIQYHRNRSTPTRAIVEGAIAVVSTTNGGAAVIDTEDLDRVRAITWYVHRSGYIYAHTGEERKWTLMHRMLMSAPGDKFVDHISGNRWDNRKSNLRLCNNTENTRNAVRGVNNTSGFKGVTFHKQHQRWNAQITKDREIRFLGLFDDPVEAALAYDDAARELHGEFARVNFPTKGEQAA